MPVIDLNCDLGEGGRFDADIMPLISSCNIACGGHAGDETIIAVTIELALAHQVNIGAHPSYPDKANFGRKPFWMEAGQLKEAIQEQIEKVQHEVQKQGGVLHHVKPHGALYNELKSDMEKAAIVIQAVYETDPDLRLFVPPDSAILKQAEKKLPVWIEGFADRNYETDFSLTPRSQPGAVLTEKEEVLRQVRNMAGRQRIVLKNGNILQQQFDTICLHSDTKNSLTILRHLHEVLPNYNIIIS